jgi:hypothetical protein
MGIQELTAAARAAGFAMAPREDDAVPVFGSEIGGAALRAAEPQPAAETAHGRTQAVVPLSSTPAPRWSVGVREWWLALSGRAVA